MITVTNPVPVPFFERIPRRLLPAIRRACDRAETSRDMVSDQHRAFLAEISGEGVPGPTLEEFRVWFEGVKLGLTTRVDYELKPFEPVAKGVVERMIAGQFASVAVVEPQVEEYLRKAHAIIMAAVRLYQAKIDAGYSPESSETEDQIVADAITEWLTAEATGWSQAMNLDYTPAEVAVQLLSTKDRDQGAKLLDMFATYMQRELAIAIVEGGAKGGVL